jgi:hypothetical protein
MDTAPTSAESFIETASREVRKAQDVARGRFGELTPGQLAWSPEPEKKWSVGQCLEHLLKTNHLYLKAMVPAAATLSRNGDPSEIPIRGGAFGRWFTRIVGPGSRLPAPGTFRVRQAQDPEALTDVVDRFAAQQDRVLQFLDEAAGRPLDDVRIASPASGLIRFRLSDGIRAMIAHVWRHLAQAERVLDHPSFPRTLDRADDRGQSSGAMPGPTSS